MCSLHKKVRPFSRIACVFVRYSLDSDKVPPCPIVEYYFTFVVVQRRCFLGLVPFQYIAPIASRVSIQASVFCLHHTFLPPCAGSPPVHPLCNQSRAVALAVAPQYGFPQWQASSVMTTVMRTGSRDRPARWPTALRTPIVQWAFQRRAARATGARGYPHRSHPGTVRPERPHYQCTPGLPRRHVGVRRSWSPAGSQGRKLSTCASRRSFFAPADEKRSQRRSSCFGLIEWTAKSRSIKLWTTGPRGVSVATRTSAASPCAQDSSQSAISEVLRRCARTTAR